jgi:hypothetical protein
MTWLEISILEPNTGAGTYRSNTTDCIVVPRHGDLDRFDILSKGKILYVLITCRLRPVPTIKQSKLALNNFKVLLNDGKQL